MNWKDLFPKENRYFETENGILYCGDCLEILKNFPDNFIDLVVTSPPYNKHSANRSITKKDSWKKANINYGIFKDNLPEKEYQEQQIKVLKELIRILKFEGSIFYNHKPRIKNHSIIFPHEWLMGNFIIRQMIIWYRKSSPTLQPIRFLPNTEYIFWITKERKTPKFNPEALKYGEVWEITPQPNPLHPAPFPEEIPRRCVLSTTKENDIVLDPYAGIGTTLFVSGKLNRRWIGIEINPDYCEIAKKRIEEEIKQRKLF